MLKEKVDLTIIGAPRSGTTSLHNWLSSHPEIEGSTPKETYFFCDDGCLLKESSRIPKELKLSEFYSQQNCLWLESTPYNFFQRNAIRKFKDMSPLPLIIVMLRDPSERLLSAFNYSKFSLKNIVDDYTFGQYVEDLITGRINNYEVSNNFKRKVDYMVAKDGLLIGRYQEWLSNWFDNIPQEKIAIYGFKELCTHPQKITHDICEMLNIDSSLYDNFSFEILNSSPSNKKYEYVNAHHRVKEGLFYKLLKEYYEEWNMKLFDEYSIRL